ncbi:DUF445 domain-containing protein [Saliterribacillus persicus]|uniref:Uncharacterized membrane protein YheB (UPF0754 family) n=1 Tax=Saliterribacillus persicus TaxID=930114 RepID=A0A368XNR3_9BACI|nr:DUF445 family protein [Saliterribacillus persicus]RCW69652.1 uncharacterized membrane protein YheB (UPF0754 family) [Saliterribacillus persicus]
MGIALTILTMILIGALIGGLTNSLAIKMLFRPYEAKYIGKWRLPFTPGVIPKRREQLAVQLGDMVVDYLITPDGMQKKLKDPALKQQLLTFFNKEWRGFKENAGSLTNVLEKLNITVKEEDIKRKISTSVLEFYKQKVEENRDTSLKSIFEGKWEEEIKQLRSELVEIGQTKAAAMLKEEETKSQIRDVIEQYIASRGFIANMIASMFNSEELAGKVQHLLVQYIESKSGKEWLASLVESQWQEWMKKDIGAYEAILLNRQIQSALTETLENNLPIRKVLDKPIHTFIEPYEKELLERILPQMLDQALEKIASKIPTMLDHLALDKIVEEQVASFPTSRIEQLLLSISKREFKLITYLGAVLGGLIGAFQGIIFVFFG